MSNLSQVQKIWVLFGLIIFMSATRFHHFGSVNFLPDASLAIFFLAGFYLLNKSSSDVSAVSRFFSSRFTVFSLLIFEAGLIDYIAIQYGGVSDWCVTPAYLFLIPTYGVMFYAGKWCAQSNLLTVPGALKTAGILVGAVSLSFLISNGSFYFFAGRYEGLNWFAYGESVSGYFLSYAGYTLLYSGMVLGIQACLMKTSLREWAGFSH